MRENINTNLFSKDGIKYHYFVRRFLPPHKSKLGRVLASVIIQNLRSENFVLPFHAFFHF